MTKVIFDISMSLDGYIAAPKDRPGEELGDGGQRLHAWLFDRATDADREVAEETSNGAGAVVSGRERATSAWTSATTSRPPSSLGSSCLMTSRSDLPGPIRGSSSSWTGSRAPSIKRSRRPVAVTSW